MAQTIGNLGGNFLNNEQNITSNQTLSSGSNYMSVGPITINSGVVVTVNSGSYWIIV